MSVGIAQQAVNIVNMITLGDRYKEGVRRHSQAITAIAEHREEWRKRLASLNTDHNTLLLEQRDSIRNLELALKNHQTSGQLLENMKSAERRLEQYLANAKTLRMNLTKTREEIGKSREAKELVKAREERHAADVMLNAYDPLTATLNDIGDEVETELSILLKTFTEGVVDVRYFHLKGSLHGIIDGEPLTATLDVWLADQQLPRITLEFYLGDVVKFFDAIWKLIQEALKETFGIVI